jgi:crotonobetainyl-CoA:carnitine CoA-transferase CaiB-like acyl-CoA transferase
VSEERQKKFCLDLLTSVGLDPKDAGGSLSFTGPTDPIYDSPYFLAEGTSAILGAIGSAVAQIWKARSGEEQDIVVDRLHAVQALHRVNFLRQSDYPIILTMPSNPTSWTHRCKDGRFMETNTGLRHLELAMLDLLDCANTDAACREAFMLWNASELEEKIARHNLCGAVHRTCQEWRKHPQGMALMESPVITIEKISDSAPEPFAPAQRPLSGVRVLDHTHIIAGPMVSNALAEQGADVLHVACHKHERVSIAWIDTGFGKLSCYLDLDEPRDMARYNDLVKDGDVVVEGYAPGVMDRRGFSARRLAQLRPGLIYLSECTYGHTGPWALRKGFENIAQAATGVSIDHGSEDSPIMCPALFMNDYGTGYLGALGVLAALIRRAKEGGSYHVRVSLCRTAMYFQDLGEVPMDERRAKLTGRLQEGIVSSILPAAAINEINNSAVLIQTQTGLGTITHMAPVIQYSKTKAYWERPLVYLGASKAEWPDRSPNSKTAVTSLRR